VRGGRVRRFVKRLSDVFRVTPILGIGRDGNLGMGGVLFGRRDPYRKFGEFVRRRLGADRRWRVGIAHANVPDGAEAVRAAIAEAAPGAEFLPVMPLGTALGVHAGPGCVVVAVQELDPG